MNKKKKVRTCGNCIHLIKVKPNDGNYKYYRCIHPITNYNTYYRNSTPTECEYHIFRNDIYNDKEISESTKDVIKHLFGDEEAYNRLLTFLKEKK